MRYAVLKEFVTPIHRFHEGDEVEDIEIDGVLLPSDWVKLGYLSHASEDNMDVLREEAAALGIKVDRRWGAKRIAEAIEEEKLAQLEASRASEGSVTVAPSE
jgi:hypothetical protein